MGSESLQQTPVRAVGTTSTQRGEGGRGMRLVTLRTEGDQSMDLDFDPRLTVVIDPEPEEITKLLDDAARHRQRGLELVAELSEQTAGPIPEGTFGVNQSFQRSRSELQELLQTFQDSATKTHEYREQRTELETQRSTLLEQRTQARLEYEGQTQQIEILQSEMQVRTEQSAAIQHAFEAIQAVDLKRTRARQLAEQWVETKTSFLQLSEPDPSLPAAMATNERQLRQAQHQLREATAKAKQLTPEEEARLREVHQNLEEAQRGVEKRANRRGLKTLEEAEQAEVALLKELGLLSYLDFILSISVPESDKAQMVKEARSKLAITEREHAALNEQYAMATEYEHLKEHLLSLRSEAREILGSEPGGDANTELLQYADYKNPRQQFREALISTLRTAQVDTGSDPVSVAENWLAMQTEFETQTSEQLDEIAATMSQDKTQVQDLEQELLGVEAELRQVETLEDEETASVADTLPIVVNDQFFRKSNMDESFALLAELGEFVQVIIVSGDAAVIERAQAISGADVREVRPLVTEPEAAPEPFPAEPVATILPAPVEPVVEPQVIPEEPLVKFERKTFEPPKPKVQPEPAVASSAPEKPTHKFRRQRKTEKVSNGVISSTPVAPQKLGRCRKHQIMEATALCSNCKHPFCDECLIKVNPRRQLCLDCALKLSGVRTGWRR